MAKIGSIFPGKVFLMTAVTGVTIGIGSLAKGEILLPPEPMPALPPGDVRDAGAERELDRRMEEKRDAMRQSREKRDPRPAPATTPSKVDEALTKEAAKPRPYKFQASVQVLQPFFRVSKPRQDYRADLTALAQASWLLAKEFAADSWQPWLGFRIAPFAGEGSYDGDVGRFGWTYFGPIVTWASMDRGGEDPNSPLESGQSITLGLSAQTRRGRTDAGAPQPAEDLDSRPLAFDAPGLHAEYRKLWIHYGAVSSHVSIGVQFGKGKTIAWVGAGWGGLY